MKLATGIVIDGKVVVSGAQLTESATVTVMVKEDAEAFELGMEDEAELMESVAAIERGDYVSAEDLLERLRRIG